MDLRKPLRILTLLVDGGYYHGWIRKILASKHNVDPDFVVWRKRLEYVRKDIEDVFGILKGRFGILKLPIKRHCGLERERFSFYSKIRMRNAECLW
jgi:hypothetical protein